MKDEPAFPAVGEVYGDKDDTRWAAGMTLRDYFAAKTLPYLGHMQAISINQGEGYHDNDIATMAYEIADAMLQEREKNKE